jgi:hypothetical protein
MKRVLTAAVISGFMVLVPQVAFGGTAQPVTTPANHGPQHSSGDCAGRTEEANQPQRDDGRGYYDREQEDSDGGEVLF